MHKYLRRHGIVRQVVGLLAEAERDLVSQIERRLAWIAERGFDASPFTLQRLESNLAEVQSVMREAYGAIGKELKRELDPLARYEAEWSAAELTRGLRGVGLNLGVGLAEGDLLRQIVVARPFQGGLLKDWARSLLLNDFKRVKSAIRQGLLQGESIDKIVRRIRGTRAANFADGILSIGRREAEAVVRTAVMHVAANAREETWKANSDLVESLTWVATLDARTCEECMIRDGLEYTLDGKPIGHSVPWLAGPGRLHFNDRCTSVPNLVSWRKLGIRSNEVTGEQRAALDGFVPSTMSFGQWIVTQPAAVQDDVLGAVRGRALRAGEITFSDFFDSKGKWMTLDELRAKEAA
jgi:SPP1 gp7 family putative phage head morphogenesis protein